MRIIRKTALAAAVALLCQAAYAANPATIRVAVAIEQQPLRTALQSLADQTGLQKGDVIFQINNYPIRRAEDAAKVIDAMGGRSYLRVLVERQGQAFVTEFVIR